MNMGEIGREKMIDELIINYREHLQEEATNLFKRLTRIYEVSQQDATNRVLGEHSAFLAYLASVMDPNARLEFAKMVGKEIIEFGVGD